MKSHVKTVPDGYHTITPCIMVQAAGQQLDFLKKAFNALELSRMTASDGTIIHAELKIGDSMIMLGEAKGHGLDLRPADRLEDARRLLEERRREIAHSPIS